MLAMDRKHALIIGITGVVGSNLAEHLLAQDGWRITGVSQSSLPPAGPIASIRVDLLDKEATAQAFADLRPTHVFFCTWTRRATEAENVLANGAMIAHVLNGLAGAGSVQHTALVTGTKHYLGPFESYGKTRPDTPFKESMPRLPGQNFYYTQEDVLFERAARDGYSWSVHRPHTIIGHAIGNAMNMGVTLAVYAAICKATGRPFTFPGSPEQYEAVTDLTDARLLARQLAWASTSPEGRNQAFNAVNGEVFRWRQMWAWLADHFVVENGGLPDTGQPLARQMEGCAPVWNAIVNKHGLQPIPLERLASWWHTDADLGRNIECFNSMAKSRWLGFNEFQSTEASFRDLFERLRLERIIP